MKKVFEALERIGNNLEHHYPENIRDFNTIKQALTELQQIKESKPSEVFGNISRGLETIEADLTGLPKHVIEYDDGFDNYLEDIWTCINFIKQTLLKAQEQEKVLDLIFTKTINIWQIKTSKNAFEYNKFIESINCPINQEEFDLLKRWSDNENNK